MGHENFLPFIVPIFALCLGISNFLEEISSLSHSVGFLYFFALITEEGILISPCYSLELCIPGGSDGKASAYSVEDRIQSLGGEDLLEKEMTTHSSILTWKILWMEERVGYSSWGHKESDTTERLHFHFHSFFLMKLTV